MIDFRAGDKAFLFGLLILVSIGLATRDQWHGSVHDTPQQIVEARQTVKRLKFAPWDVETCKKYQIAGYKVCKYDRETGYHDNGPYDSIGNELSRGCDEWLNRANSYCPKCTGLGRCDEPFE